jgi:hypothetical protein
MAIEAFRSVTDMLYIAKWLYNMGKYELVKQNFFDVLDYDVYYENLYGLIGDIFERHYCKYSEGRNVELHVSSDPVMADFYILAGEYGQRVGIPDYMNPYIIAAEEKARRLFSFSYCLDWSLKGYTKPNREFHSRLGLLLYQDDYIDLSQLVYGLVGLYSWFAEQRDLLKNLLSEEAIAA